MIIKNEDRTKHIRHGVRDGHGNVYEELVVPPEELCGNGRLYAKETLKPGDSIGYHDHQGEREIYFILDGKAKVIDDGMPSIVLKDDVMITGSGHAHSIENVGSKDLIFMALIINESDHE